MESVCLKPTKSGKMKLPATNNINLLSFDGIVEYYGQLFSKGDADDYYQTLLDKIEWQNDEAIMFGKRIITKRKVAWYGDRPFEYKYSKITKTALPWTIELIQLKNKIQSPSKAKFNSCLLNLYHDGSEGMAWHSDDEKDLQKNGCIGSLTFGAERKFCFKHKVSGEVVFIILEHGSLLLMKGTTQTHWRHRLPPTKLIHSPRINLTFRTILE